MRPIIVFLCIAVLSMIAGIMCTPVAYSKPMLGKGCKESSNTEYAIVNVSLMSKISKKYYYARLNYVQTYMCGKMSEVVTKLPKFFLIRGVPKQKELRSGYCAKNVKIFYDKKVPGKTQTGNYHEYSAWKIINPKDILFKPCRRI